MKQARQMPMNPMPGGMPETVEVRPDEYVFASEVEGYVEAMPGVWIYDVDHRSPQQQQS